jgi:hypothetical protein
MTNYLEAAAALVKKAADANETDRGRFESYRDDKRVEYAKTYALLAAIDKGLMPEAVAEEIYGQLRSGR